MTTKTKKQLEGENTGLSAATTAAIILAAVCGLVALFVLAFHAVP